MYDSLGGPSHQMNNWEGFLTAPDERMSLAPHGRIRLPLGIKLSTSTACIKLGLDGDKLTIDIDALLAYVQARRDNGRSVRIRPKESTYRRCGPCGAVVLEAKRTGFGRQTTLILRVPSWRAGRRTCKVNIKVFHNGSQQLTGVDHPATGIHAARAVVALCLRIGAVARSSVPTAGAPPVVAASPAAVAADPPLPTVGGMRMSYATVNTNCVHHLGFKIDRTALFYLLSRTYRLLVLYDPTHYPAVNTKFFANSINTVHDGQCRCFADRAAGYPGPATRALPSVPHRRRRGGTGIEQRVCIRRSGTGNGLGDCRRITVSFFQSGSVLFTGARNCTQVSQVANFVFDICRRHRTHIQASTTALAPTVDGSEDDPLRALLLDTGDAGCDVGATPGDSNVDVNVTVASV